MTAGRPIGNHIRSICTTLEGLGSADARTLLKHFPDIEASNMSKYCSRAVGLGLMTVKLGTRKPKDSNVYKVVPGWLAMADERKTTKLKPPKPRNPKAQPTTTNQWRGVSSVFQMGI